LENKLLDLIKKVPSGTIDPITVVENKKEVITEWI